MSSKTTQTATMSTEVFTFTRETPSGVACEYCVSVTVRYTPIRIATIVFGKRAELYLNDPFGVKTSATPIASAFIRRHEEFAPALMRYFQERLLSHIEILRDSYGPFYAELKELTHRLERYRAADRRTDWFELDNSEQLAASEFCDDTDFIPGFFKLLEKERTAAVVAAERNKQNTNDSDEASIDLAPDKDGTKPKKRHIVFSPSPSPSYAGVIRRDEERQAAESAARIEAARLLQQQHREKSKKRKADSDDDLTKFLDQLDDDDEQQGKAKQLENSNFKNGYFTSAAGQDEKEQEKKKPVAAKDSDDDDNNDDKIGDSPSKIVATTLEKKTPVTASVIKRVPGAPMLRKTRSAIDEPSTVDAENLRLARRAINFVKQKNYIPYDY